MCQTTVPFDSLPDEALIPFGMVSAITGWKRTKIHCDVLRGAFPRPLKLGRNVRWRVGDLRVYLNRMGALSAEWGKP